MDIATLGAVGEFVGGIAVLITLIYLAYQTRLSARMHQQSVSDLESQIISQNADGWVQVFLQTAKDERLSAIYEKLVSARPLDPSEFASAQLFLSAYFLRLENIEFQRRNLNWEAMGIDDLLRKQVGTFSASPDFQSWWSKASSEGFSDWFVDAVNSILEARS
ncbi:MAG TPA: hypothetical protein VIS55_16860 [Pseudomonadales bacterium]|jgi:hypothetical protein